MLVSKSFVVTGETVHRNGKKEKDIDKNVDNAINSFLRELKGRGTLVDLKPSVQLGSTQDTAFITIIVDVPEEEEPVSKSVKVKK